MPDSQGSDGDEPDEVGSEGDPIEDADSESTEEVDEFASALLEAAEYRDHLQRVQAEFENYRKRVSRERMEATAIATGALVEQLLEVLDEFELALGATESLGAEHASVTKGIEAVYAKLFDTLRKQGLQRIDETGAGFDANIHEAVASATDGSGDDDLVVAEVFRPGYRVGSRVIRPAMVKVGHSDKAND